MAHRGAAREAELAPPTEVVDLHDHAVDLVVEVVAVLLPPLAVRLHLHEVREHRDLGVDRQAGGPEEVERLVVAGEAAAPTTSSW